MTMGFRPKPKQYRLTFTDDPELAELEVVMGSVTVGEWNEMVRPPDVADADEDSPAAAERLQELSKANDWLLGLFADRLVRWNLEAEDGSPVPVTLDGVLSQDKVLVGQLIRAWQVALAAVPKTSQKPSANGEITVEDLAALAASSSPPS